MTTREAQLEASVRVLTEDQMAVLEDSIASGDHAEDQTANFYAGWLQTALARVRELESALDVAVRALAFIRDAAKAVQPKAEALEIRAEAAEALATRLQAERDFAFGSVDGYIQAAGMAGLGCTPGCSAMQCRDDDPDQHEAGCLTTRMRAAVPW